MRILVTNDDGFQAPGLAALVRVAERYGEVVVLAPREEQSYAGHRVTVGAVLTPVEYAPGRFHLNGTPADCVRIALGALRWEVGLVLSGINRGGNLGADIHTSGTVAAAREAAYLGRPAVALSQYVHAGHDVDWTQTEAVAGRCLDELLRSDYAASNVYWNVNLPHPEPEHGVKQCEPDFHPLDVRYEEVEGGYRFAGRYQQRPRTSGRDVATCFDGYVTVSRLSL
jgi:5'-nucleotidase